MSGSELSTDVTAYAERFIPGYTTVGSMLIEGKCALKTRPVNLEFARMMSDCPVHITALLPGMKDNPISTHAS